MTSYGIRLRRWFRLPAWVRMVDRTTLAADASAGLTGGIIVVPQAVAFATIAGMPPEYGLYAAMVPAIVGALFGSSWQLVSGPTTAISIVVFSTLSPLAEPGSPDYVRLALSLAFLSGVVQLLLGWLRMGTLVNFISHTVVIGFTAGAAVLIAANQLKSFFGLKIARGGSFIETMTAFFSQLDEINPWVTAVSTVTFAVSMLARRLLPTKVPHMIVAMVAGGLLAWLLDRGFGPAVTGITYVDALPRSLPPLSHPDLSVETVGSLLPIAMALAMLSLTEAVSISRSIAIRTGQRIDGNREFIGQGLSNVAGSFFSAYPTSGSFNRSGLNHEAGARTPLAAVFAAIVLALIVLFIAPLAAWLPLPTMAGILFVVAWGLIDVRNIRHVLHASRAESAVLGLTFVATLVLELEFAIYIGVLASLLLFLNRTSRPRIADVKPAAGVGAYHLVDDTNLPDCPQLKMLRIDGPLFFGAVDHVQRALTDVDEREPRQKHLLLHCVGIGMIDLAGAEMLAQEARRRQRIGGALYLYNLRDGVRGELSAGGYDVEIGRDRLIPMTTEGPVAGIAGALDPAICAACTRRIFRACPPPPPPRETAT
ncbi:MAG: SulP family inorganic anion transporter [Lautropia sp.]